jgi:hypothetical protein
MPCQLLLLRSHDCILKAAPPAAPSGFDKTAYRPSPPCSQMKLLIALMLLVAPEVMAGPCPGDVTGIGGSGSPDGKLSFV